MAQLRGSVACLLEVAAPLSWKMSGIMKIAQTPKGRLKHQTAGPVKARNRSGPTLYRSICSKGEGRNFPSRRLAGRIALRALERKGFRPRTANKVSSGKKGLPPVTLRPIRREAAAWSALVARCPLHSSRAKTRLSGERGMLCFRAVDLALLLLDEKRGGGGESLADLSQSPDLKYCACSFVLKILCN